MKNIVTNYALCIKMTLKSGEILAFTNHTKDIIHEDIVYSSANSFNISAIENRSDLIPGNLDISGMISSDQMTEEDILNGKFDGASLEFFKINYLNPKKTIYLKKVIIGNIQVSDNGFVANLEDLKTGFYNKIGEYYSKSCRAKFCDQKCKLLIDDFKYTSKITEITGKYSFKIDLDVKNHFFKEGEILLDKNYPIKDNIGSQIFILDKLNIKLGQEVILQRGCDKSFLTCKNEFGNVINFRGEPYINGIS